jgi:hypothetical protein
MTSRVALPRPVTSLLLAAPLLSGCLSVRWESGGVERQLGLFVYEDEALAAGRRITRTSFGLDVRLSGPDRGVSLGLKKTREIEPLVVRPEGDPYGVPDVVAAYLAGDRSALAAASARAPRWGAFYWKTPAGFAPVALRNMQAGLEWSWIGERASANVGLIASERLIGAAVDEDIVLLRSADDASAEEWVMWTLTDE